MLKKYLLNHTILNGLWLGMEILISSCAYIFFAVITYYTNNDTGTMDMLVWKCSEEWFRVIKRKDVFVDEHLSHASTNG